MRDTAGFKRLIILAINQFGTICKGFYPAYR